MRSSLATFGLCGVLMLTGCENNWGFLRKSPEPNLTSAKPPTSSELVSYLNSNSQRIHSLMCQDVDLDVQQGVQPIGGLTAKMACEQPRDFRMSAVLMGKNEFQLGSNEREFWYWIGRSNPPYQFFCSYEDLRTKRVELRFPFQPEWVMETLGMATYPVDGRYSVVDKRDTIELSQDTTSLQGQPVRKVVVFHRRPMKNGGQVESYVLRDMKGKDLCSAQIQESQRIGDAIVPYKIVLSWPAEKTKLSMKINKPTLNQVSPDQARSLFTRVPLKDVPSFDLARGGDGGGQVQQAGGYVR